MSISLFLMIIEYKENSAGGKSVLQRLWLHQDGSTHIPELAGISLNKEKKVVMRRPSLIMPFRPDYRLKHPENWFKRLILRNITVRGYFYTDFSDFTFICKTSLHYPFNKMIKRLHRLTTLVNLPSLNATYVMLCHVGLDWQFFSSSIIKAHMRLDLGAAFTQFMFIRIFFFFTLIILVLHCLFYATKQINSQLSTGFIIKSGLCWDNVSVQLNTVAVWSEPPRVETHPG